jgi:hypothetical protein
MAVKIFLSVEAGPIVAIILVFRIKINNPLKA